MSPIYDCEFVYSQIMEVFQEGAVILFNVFFGMCFLLSMGLITWVHHRWNYHPYHLVSLIIVFFVLSISYSMEFVFPLLVSTLCLIFWFCRSGETGSKSEEEEIESSDCKNR